MYFKIIVAFFNCKGIRRGGAGEGDIFFWVRSSVFMSGFGQTRRGKSPNFCYNSFQDSVFMCKFENRSVGQNQCGVSHGISLSLSRGVLFLCPF